MSKLRALLCGALAFVVCARGEAATTPASPARPVGSDPAASDALVKAATKLKAASASNRDAASKLSGEVATLASQRKQLLTALANQKKAHKQRLTAARSAAQRYQQKSKQGKLAAADEALLETARQEHAAAEKLGETLLHDTGTLRALEETLAAKLAQGSAAAGTAKQSAADARLDVTQLKAIAKSAIDETQQAGSALAAAAASARAGAQLSPASYAARRAKLKTDDDKLAMKAAEAGARLGDAQGLLKELADQEKVAKQAATPGPCDVKKIDWANRLYPAGTGDSRAYVLIKGSAVTVDGTGSYQLEKVGFADLTGNQVLEAYVPVEGPGGPRASSYLTVYVYEVDKKCLANLIGSLAAGPYVESAAISGSAYVVKRQMLGEMGMPGDPEVARFTFKAGKFVESDQ